MTTPGDAPKGANTTPTADAVAWRIDNVSPSASPLGRTPFVVWSEEDADRYAHDDERRFNVTPLYGADAVAARDAAWRETVERVRKEHTNICNAIRFSGMDTQCACGADVFNTALETLLAAYADAARDRERDRVDITKRADVACYEIRYLVPKADVHAFSGHDFAGVVGRAVANKWRETFDAARTGEAR